MSIHGLPICDGVSATTASPSTRLGTRVLGSDGVEYVYGYNASNSYIFPGVPVVVGSSNTGYSFTITNAASQVGLVMGVCHNATIATSYYGWYAVNGLVRVVPDGSQVSFNAGVNLAIGVDGGFVAQTGATFSTGHVWGQSVESIVTGYGSCASEATSGLAALGRGWVRTFLG